MSNAGMAYSKFFFIMSYKIFIGIPLICVLGIFVIVMGSMIINGISNLIEYGYVRPCVWKSDYVAFGGNLDDLEYEPKLGCYLKTPEAMNLSICCNG